MKRKITFLISAAVMLLTMMATTGEMWGQTRDEITYDFSNISGFDQWGTSYSQHDVEYDDATVIFASANHQTSTITDIPVTKGQPVSLVLNNPDDYQITAVTFVCRQWGTKAQTITLHYSTDGGSTYTSTGVTSTNFTITKSSLAEGTNAVKITFSSTSNQVGIESCTYTFESTSSDDPTINANNVNIAYNATQGSIGYTLNNATGNVTAEVTTGNWLELGEITSSAVPFTCSANTGAERTATVTLSFTGASNKIVTVTQDAAPNNISDITAASTDYIVIGTVVATNSKGFVIGDGTGYVYTYLGSAPSQAVNDKVKIAGTTGTYGQILQFTSNASITTSQTSNYDGTPAVTVINAVPDYSTGLHLSTYLQFEGELEESISNYYITVGSDQIQISYPTTAQSTALSALDGKNVRVKGYFSGNNSSGYFSVMMESVEEVTTPILAVDPATAQAFTYVEGNGPSDDQMFTVTGTNLVSADITATVSSDYEITDDQAYSSSVTIASGDIVSVRLKAGLAKGTHNGTLTLSSTDATNVVINLSGTVTGQTYTINLDDQVVGGTIEADFASAEEGTTVTLTPHPTAAYTFGSWTVYQDDLSTEVTVTDNQFTMPACEVYVTATFNLKPTYVITKVVTPDNSGTIETDNTAWEGKTVTVLVEAANGYSFSSIVISKTNDPETTISTTGNAASGFTFTMPGYAVTATANFVSNTYEGAFVQYSGDLTEGDYILVYNNQAMNDTLNGTKYKVTSVNAVENVISNPSRAIVWHIASSKAPGYWTICSVATSKYVSGSTSSTDVGAVTDTTGTTTNWKTSGTYDFRCKANEGQSTARYLRNNNGVFGNYASSNGGALTLYKYTELTERTITFHGNGGLYQGNETYTQVVYDGIATNLTANQFTLANSAFAGWSTTQNGEVEYADGASITVTESDLDLYAKWGTSYTAMVDDAIVGGTVKVNGEDIVEVAEGTEMTLTYTANQGYAFSAWNVYKDGDQTTTVNVENNAFTMPAYDVIVSATFVEVTTYSLVTNVNQIVSGKHYIIANGTDGSVKVMAGQNTNNRASVVATATNNLIPETEGIYEFVINGPVDMDKGNETISVYTIYDTCVASTGYLYAASSSKNYLRTQSTLNDNGRWTITISDNKATIKAQGSYTNNWMRNNGDLFSCYGSGQADIYLYVKVNDNDLEYYGSEITYNQNTIPDGGSLTIGAGSVVTVPNSFVNDDPADLVIEDGAQLIHTSPVEATIQKNVTAASSWNSKGVDGWHFIASPVDGLSTSVVASDHYDLYKYDEETAYWIYDHGASAATPFSTLERGKGYLYASKDPTTLDFAGSMEATNATIQKDLSWSCSTYPELKGFNLMGNPFTRNLTTGDMKIDATSVTSYYGINAATNDIITYNIADNPIKPGQGFMVQATAASQKLIFNPTSKDNDDIYEGYISIKAGNDNSMDKAFVQIGNGNTLRKMTLSDNTMVYVMNDDEDYAAARVDELAGSMPVHFKTIEAGTQTITIEARDIEAYSMKLIDNFTNEVIDLLLEPTYTFEAEVGDDEARFLLVFDFNNYANVEEGFENSHFAYQFGDELILNGNGTLQVFDVMGRFVMSRTINGSERISTSALNSGVYVLRLDNKIQKIVIR